MKKRKSAPSPRIGAGAVFVVDDDATLAEYAQTVLEAAGWKVRSFTDPRAVLKALRTAKPKPLALVTDYEMGKMDGLSLVLAVHKFLPSLKTIVLSGTIDPSVVETHPARVDRFLAKPYKAAQLQKIMADLLRP